MNSSNSSHSNSINSNTLAPPRRLHGLHRVSGLFHRTHSNHSLVHGHPLDTNSIYSLDGGKGGIAEEPVNSSNIPAPSLGGPTPSVPAITNVEFNNIRSQDPADHRPSISSGQSHGPIHPNSSSTSLFRLHSTSSQPTTISTSAAVASSAMSILGSRDSKLSKLFTKTKGRIHGQQTDSSDQSSVTTYGSSNSSATTAADIKRHEKLSIQTSTSLLPSSSKDSRSPLARTSKEVERIAGYTNAPPTIPERFAVSSNISQPAKSWTKHRSHLHLLRPRKDSLKSSSNSNSMFVSRDGGETMYSFHPSAVGTSLSTNELQSMLQELEKLSSGNGPLTEDKDAIADEAWNIFCSLVSPIFEGGRIRAPVEEINKLVYLHMKLCAAGVSNEASTAISQVPPYTPLTAPAPTFSTIYPTSSPTPSSHTLTPTLTPLGGYSKVAEEVQYFLKGGMVSLMSLLYYDDTERTIKLHNSPSKRRRGLRSNSLSNSADTALFSSNINFEKSCSLLWDTFYDDIYFYLQGVFLPLESGGVSFDESSTSSKSETGRIPVSDMVLVSFRDNVVIPLYEMNRQAETEKERRREHGNTVTSMASGISFIGSTGSKNSTKLHSASPVNLDADDMAQAYSLNLALLQCFTILNGVQTNDTNQKIIENLMQQTRERCLIYEGVST